MSFAVIQTAFSDLETGRQRSKRCPWHCPSPRHLWSAAVSHKELVQWYRYARCVVSHFYFISYLFVWTVGNQEHATLMCRWLASIILNCREEKCMSLLLLEYEYTLYSWKLWKAVLCGVICKKTVTRRGRGRFSCCATRLPYHTTFTQTMAKKYQWSVPSRH